MNEKLKQKISEFETTRVKDALAKIVVYRLLKLIDDVIPKEDAIICEALIEALTERFTKDSTTSPQDWHILETHKKVLNILLQVKSTLLALDDANFNKIRSDLTSSLN